MLAVVAGSAPAARRAEGLEQQQQRGAANLAKSAGRERERSMHKRRFKYENPIPRERFRSSLLRRQKSTGLIGREANKYHPGFRGLNLSKAT